MRHCSENKNLVHELSVMGEKEEGAFHRSVLQGTFSSEM